MSGISSSVGLISGLNTGQLIEQLLAIDAQPKTLIQKQVTQLQAQQAAYLALNSTLNGLKTAAQKLRLNKIFDSATVRSSNADVLSGTASPGAPPGNYTFLVDRVVSTHQLLSRGFVDRNTSGLGLTSLTLESTQARLDSDAQLSSLNGGAGIARGKIVVTNRAGTSTTIDLSRVASLSEVLDAFNSNSSAHVSASVSGGHLVLTDTSGGSGTLSVRSDVGYTTAASLGIEQTSNTATLTGTDISYLGDNTTIQSLNDGNGIRITTDPGNGAADFTIQTHDGLNAQNLIGSISINLGDLYTTTNGVQTKTASAVTTIGQLKARVAAQSGGKVTVVVRPDGSGLQFVDNTLGSGQLKVTDVSGAAVDLGFVSTPHGSATFGGTTFDSKTLLAGLQSRLASTLRGGQGLSSKDVSITARDGTNYSFTLANTGSVTDLLNSIRTGTNGAVTASLDANGTSIILTDSTGGTSNLIVSGGGADQLGLTTAVGGVAAATVTGTRIDRQYISESTPVSSLNDGHGIGTGSFKIIGASGASKTVNIGSDIHTVGDVLNQINSGSIGIHARINDAGNGIIVEKDPSFTGPDQKISISDQVGGVASALNLAGDASGTGASNYIDGSFRRSVSVAAADTLDQVIQKINSAHAGVTASVVTDGSSAAPYRLKLTAADAGTSGQFLVTSGGVDLGLSLISSGQDARVFYGSDDPARAILVQRPSNQVDGVIDGLSIDAKAASSSPITLTVSRDVDGTLKAIQDFVTAFNAVTSKVADLTKYDADSQQRGILLGDSTALSLNNDLFNTLQASALGSSGQFRRLGQVGLKINQDNTISIDSDKLRTALQTDPQSVADLFSGFAQQQGSTTIQPLPGVTGVTVNNPNATPTYTKLGILEKLANLADKYIDSTSGILTARKKSLDDQITADNKRISDIDDRLDAKRTLLQGQFAKLESTLAQLQGQQASLAGIRAAS